MTIAIGIQLETEVLLVCDSRWNWEDGLGTFEDRGSKIEDLGSCRAVWSGLDPIGPWAHFFAAESKIDTSTLDLRGWNNFTADYISYLANERNCLVASESTILPELQSDALVASPTHGLLQIEACGSVRHCGVRKVTTIGTPSPIALGAAMALGIEQSSDRGYVLKSLVRVVEITCRVSQFCGMPCHIERVPLWGAGVLDDCDLGDARDIAAVSRHAHTGRRGAPNPVSA